MALKSFNQGTLNTVSTIPTEPGLVHINTTSFSAVAQQDITSCFSATYDNYFIHYSGVNVTNDTELQLLLLASATASVTGYYQGGQTVNSSGTLGTLLRANGSTFRINGNGSNNWPQQVFMNVGTPFTSDKTQLRGQGNWVTNSANGSAYFAGVHNVANSYDGFRIKASSGNITGSVSTYGLAKA